MAIGLNACGDDGSSAGAIEEFSSASEQVLPGSSAAVNPTESSAAASRTNSSSSQVGESAELSSSAGDGWMVQDIFHRSVWYLPNRLN